MSKEVRSHLWIADVPDASIDEEVVDIDQGADDEPMSFKSSVWIVESFIYPDKYDCARNGESACVLEEARPVDCEGGVFFSSGAIELNACWKR